jgi:hypothetical protein
MQREPNGQVSLELADIIRMNQLVRGRLDAMGFADWYDSLDPQEQIALTSALHEFAREAGVDASLHEAAVAAAGLRPDHPAVRLVLPPEVTGQSSAPAPRRTLCDVPADTRRAAFTYLVRLFGLAEQRVLRAEGPECNHWWHRDLLDPRVVRDLLRDPRYYGTSRRDDRHVRGWRRFLPRSLSRRLGRR